MALCSPALTPAAHAVDVHPEWGSTTAQDAKLKRGCHQYAYQYAVTPPQGDWSLETFLYGPGGEQLGSGYFVVGDDPLAGSSTFRLCGAVTRGGRYTIRALLSVQTGPSLYTEGYLPDTTFRLHKSRR